MRRTLLALTLVLAACGAGLGASGSRCATSEECAAGLLCDTTQTPAICNDKLSDHPDGSIPVDHGAVVIADLAGADLSGVAPMDLSGVDQSAAVHDLATKD